MKRVTLSLAVSIVLVGVIGSIAAMQGTSSPTTGPPTGKTVVVVAKGIDLGIRENVRFESIGQHDYIVVPMDPGETQAKHDVWLSLGEVVLLRVFDSKEDAVAYVNRRTRREAPPGLIGEYQDASNTLVLRGDVTPKYVKYAVGLIRKYDSNNDGVLTQDEGRRRVGKDEYRPTRRQTWTRTVVSLRWNWVRPSLGRMAFPLPRRQLHRKKALSRCPMHS